MKVAVPHLGSSCSFLEAGQICWAVLSRIFSDGYWHNGDEVLFWEIADSDGQKLGWITPWRLENCIAIMGRIPPDAVLDLMPDPGEVRVFTLKQGSTNALVCTSLGGDIVWQSDNKELRVKEIRQMLASQLKISIRAVNMVGEEAQILQDDMVASEIL
eukprot:gnl/TRDRNA2_/TRDRNA2_89478_c0_seq1.p1 gnl/TRDRNA2_/TRDRNA2_89478_c0~~gnl/TRDRNA2_/TRDRNA2_89478_c0_seq1.p1  ORF type:complete len:167 (+),score=18.25 gnl/TRDRNA2_/TRDRNA2_89478_c0_seq1:28-501(+)